MPGFNPDNINIHDLTIEEPEEDREISFDPEKDIPKEFWQAVEGQLDEFRTDEDWYKFLWLAGPTKIVNSDIDLKIDRPTSQGLEREHAKWQGIDHFSTVASNIKIIDPKININVSDIVWDEMTDGLKRHQKKSEWNKLFELAMRMKVIRPETDTRPDQDVKKIGMDEVEKRRKKEDWFWLSKEAMEMKILYPEIDFNFNQKEWEGMKNQLQRYMEGAHWWNFATMAMAMKVLAAEEVRVTDEGLEINMKKPSLSSDSHELPEQRKF